MSVTEYSLKSQGNIKLSTNFSVKEFKCADGSDKVLIDSQMVIDLQAIRNFFQIPIYIGSGYRTDAYNDEINGAVGSWHTKGMATDFDVGRDTTAIDPRLVCMYAETLPERPAGLGLYTYLDGTSWVHLDTGVRGQYWISTTKGGKYQYIESFLPTLRKQSIFYTNKFEAKICQLLLSKLGLMPLSKVDGKYGLGTTLAIISFQKSKHLIADGICGKATWKALFSSVKSW